MNRPAALITMLASALSACGRESSAPEAPRAAAGRWSIDRAGLGLAVDDALAKLHRDLSAKLASVPASERATAQSVGGFAVAALGSFRDLEMNLDVNADGTFSMSGVEPSGHTQESGSGTWVDGSGAVTFTFTRKNGRPFDGGTSPMRFAWQDADTLLMRVPSLDVGIALKRR